MSFLKKFEPEGFRESRAFKVYNFGSNIVRRVGVLNYVFLGIVGLHVYEHVKARWDQPRYYNWTFFQAKKPTRTIFEER